MKLLIPFVLFVQLQLFAQTTVESFYFELGKNTLSTSEKERLLKFKQNLPPTTKFVSIEGFCDTVGSIEKNNSLAEQRIETIFKILEIKNLPKKIVNGELAANSSKSYKDSDFRKVVIRYKLPVLVPPTQPLLQSFNTFINDSSSAKLYFDLSILFYPGIDKMLPNSFPQLDTLIEVLKNNTELNIIVHGHVCCSPSVDLSLARAKTAMNYLSQHGIAKNRMISAGHSNNQPKVFPEITEADMQQNRRVSVEFIKPKK